MPGLSELVRRRLGLLVPALVVLGAACALLVDPWPVQRLRNAGFDQFQRWQPRAYQDAGVRIIDLDEASLRRVGQWPWPRTRVAELLAKLDDAGAAVIGFDVVFAEADRTSPKAMLDLWPQSPSLRSQLAQLPDHDALFAAAIARRRVVLGFAGAAPSAAPAALPIKARYVQSGSAAQPYLHEIAGTLSALPELASAAAGNGALTFFPDADGVVRRVPLLVRHGETLLPSFAAEILRLAQQTRNYTVHTSAERGVGVTALTIGRLRLATTAHGEVWINYSRPLAQRYIPAWKVLAGELPANALAGQIVLVGSSAQGLMDLRFSPLGEVVPGVEVHAQLLEQLLTGDSLDRPAWASAGELLIVVGGGLLVGAVALGAGALLSLSVFSALLALLWAGAWQAFAAGGLLIDAANPSLALAAVYVGASIVRHRASERRQRWVRQAFSRYVSPNLVNHLLAHPDSLELGGRRQQCSFVFTDLTGFTTLMESLDPGAAVGLLNGYLDGMIAIAFAHQGTLDRIVGDAVAIMFSAPLPQPDHQRRALTCAIEMQRFAQRYASDLVARGVAFGQTRIGIHSGEVIVGNFGGSTIFDYRALGDPVNTASRLEGANKFLGTRVCASAATLAGCPGWPARPVGRIIAKGKSQALAVFEPLDPAAANGADDEYRLAFDQLCAASPAALQSFEQLAARRPADPLVALHLERLRRGETGDLIVMSEK